MNFLKFPLRFQTGGQVMVATISGVESDVFLVDDSNFRSFESGRDFRYFGGHYKRSPIRLQVPNSGNWTAVVIPGAGGTVRASVRVWN
jgi:hypothetical protein